MPKPKPNTIGVTRAEITKLRTALGVLDSISSIRITNATREQDHIYNRFLDARQNLRSAVALESGAAK